MFGRGAKPARTNGFGNFLLKNILLLAVSFLIALVAANQILSLFGWFLTPLSQLLGLLYTPLNDPFFVTYLGVYALLSIGVMFYRFRTGSRI